jgi:hypothetical protein
MDQLGLSAFGDRHQNGEYHSHGDAHRLTLRSTKFSANQIVLVLTCSAASGTLFDAVVGDGEQRWRDSETERLGSAEVDDQLELGRPQHRQVGRLFSLEELMTELGWTALRVRGLTRGEYLEQVRGFCRDGRARQSFRHA